MNAKQIKMLVWMVVVLLVLNVSTLGTIAYLRYFAPEYKTAPTPREACGDPHRMHNSYMSDQIGFSPAQKEQFGEIRDQHFTEIKKIRDNITNNRQRYFLEMGQKSPDMDRVDSMNREVGELHYQWARSATRFLTEAGSICTEEQRPGFIHLMHRDHHNTFHKRGKPKHHQQRLDCPEGNRNKNESQQ